MNCCATLSSWVPPRQNQNDQKGLWIGKGKDKLSVWAFWILLVTGFLITSPACWYGVHGNPVYLCYLGILSVSEHRLWGNHSWNLCLIICPLWAFAGEEGYWEKTAFAKAQKEHGPETGTVLYKSEIQGIYGEEAGAQTAESRQKNQSVETSVHVSVLVCKYWPIIEEILRNKNLHLLKKSPGTSRVKLYWSQDN